MSAVLAPERVRDTRRLRRTTAALLLPVGPAAVAVARFVLPYLSTSSPEEFVAGIAAHPAAQTAVEWLGLVALLTLVPGSFAAVRVAQRGHHPRLAVAAGALLVPAYLALSGGPGSDGAVVAGLEVGLGPDQLAAQVAQMESTPQGWTTGLLFVVGHIVGTVVLALALRGTLPRAWVVVLAISQPLHLVAVVLGNRPLDLLAWSATAAAMAVLARTLLRTTDDAFDRADRG